MSLQHQTFLGLLRNKDFFTHLLNVLLVFSVVLKVLYFSYIYLYLHFSIKIHTFLENEMLDTDEFNVFTYKWNSIRSDSGISKRCSVQICFLKM